MHAGPFRLATAALGLLLGLSAALAQERLRFIMVTHAPASDPFWAQVKSGADAAATDIGVDVDYRAPDAFDLAIMADLVHGAVGEHPDGLIVSVPDAKALAEPIAAAVDAGIPVITINSGFDIGRSLGALLHVGQGEYEAGRVAGVRLHELGATKALCLNHEPGNVALDLRCKGFIDGFGGSVEVLPVGPDAAAAGAAIAGALAADAGIDAVLALAGANAGEPAIAAAQVVDPPRQIQVGTFDVTDAVLDAVAVGRAAFAIDQQPFLQGYLPVELLALYRRHGVLPVSNVSTGPRLVDKEEAARRIAVRGNAERGG